MSMSEIFEEANFTLENRRIDSEVRLQEHIDEINRKFPELASIDKEISDLTQQQLLKSLNGENVTDIPDRIEVLEEKRAELRMKYGLCDSDFRPQPYCSVCGDTGMVEVNEDGKTIRRPCSCICEILAPTLLSLGGISKYPDMSFEKGATSFFAKNPAGEKVYSAVKILAERFKIPDMVLFGTSGQGKTFAAVSAARYYAEHGIPSMVIRLSDAQELMMEYRKIVQAFYTVPDKEKRVTALRDLIVDAELLVLDDLGVEVKTPNSEADLLYILDSRAQLGKKTIITTNYDLSTLRERYGARIYERIKRSYKCYSLSPKNAG